MAEWRCHIRNSSLWRISAIFWLLNVVGNVVTATIANPPPVYLALAGVHLSLACLSWFVSRQYRRAEQHAQLVRVRDELPATLPAFELQPISQTDDPVRTI